MHFTEGEKYGGYRIREIQMTTSEKYMFINLAAELYSWNASAPQPSPLQNHSQQTLFLN